jgi:hypothetical protein
MQANKQLSRKNWKDKSEKYDEASSSILSYNASDV